MKKRVKGRKLSRGQGARRALVRALTSSLVSEGKIITTYAKAKVISGQIDKLVNLAKRSSVGRNRRIYGLLGNDRKTLDGLKKTIVPLFSDRKGGYTRIVNLPNRRGDSAPMARIEWVKEIAKSDEKEVKGKRQKKITKVKKDKASKNENLSAKR
uniref:50S ribosomal protein L17 n=1 Tax=uncultured Microgenomates bacterium Rifle_16ft_4_minimus_38077 TaxID=1665117 RepID=A0A0H4TRR4_9BACT|nr:50S ribosomal protein L17 [uncultured Microgenomates bacterium Rifle_16ft_4_minimus_38077]